MPALDGVRVVVTRAAHQAEELAAPLRERGAETILLPMIAIAPPSDPEPLRRAAEHCDEYDWIVFTSANAVAAFRAQLPGSARECKARVAAIGTATRAAAEAEGFVVTIVPDRYVAESLIEAFETEDLTGRRVLLPTAAVTRDVVPAALRARGAVVDIVEAYRNIVPPDAHERAWEIFRAPFPDWITFASSSAVDNLVGLIGTEPLAALSIASIGPVTSKTIRKHGLTVAVEPDIHSVAGLVDALCRCVQKMTSKSKR